MKDSKKPRNQKIEYWKIDELRKTGADYNIAYGGRSDGKSFAVKHLCIEDFVTKGEKFIYLRRWDREITQASVESYFKDVKLKEYFGERALRITSWAGKLYVKLKGEGEAAKEQSMQIGYVCSLSANAHYTGMLFPDVSNILFEEIVSRDYYLPNEPFILQDFISTVSRTRKVRVWMVGNTITRFCPYFTEWNLTQIPKQQPGTIDIYHIPSGEFDDDNEAITLSIAVEYTKSATGKKGMSFGNAQKMINSGGWMEKTYPRLQSRLETYLTMYTIVVEYRKYKFLCRYLYDKEHNNAYWYVERKTTPIKEGQRVISDIFNPNPLYTLGFRALAQEEEPMFRELLENNAVYCDNLTGTEFNQVLTMMKGEI